MNQTKYLITTIALILALVFTVAAVTSWAASKEEIKQEKAEIHKMAKETLDRLYKVKPSAKNAIPKSAGYKEVTDDGRLTGEHTLQRIESQKLKKM